MGKFKKAIDKARESEPVESEPLESTKPADKTPAQRRGGKRSDPNYRQIGCYVPKDLYRRVKAKAVLDGVDVSDVVADLLDNWVGGQPDS